MVKNLCAIQGARAQSLVKELRFHKLCGTAKEKTHHEHSTQALDYSLKAHIFSVTVLGVGTTSF